ncbi:uncharacterized protein RBU57_008969 [Macrochelys suwanniensis]
MMERGYSRDATQCRVKIKELRQAYQKTKESNGRSGSQPQTCCFYEALHAMLGGAATTTPPVSVDSDDGVLSTATSSEVFADGEDEEGDEEDEAVDSTFNADFPDSQDLFITLTEIPYQPSQGSNPDRESGERSAAASVSRSTHSSPSQRLAQIRRRKKRTRDEMFSELVVCSRTEAAQQTQWRENMSQYQRSYSEREDRWQQEDQQVTQTLLGLMREQTDTLRHLVDVLQDRSNLGYPDVLADPLQYNLIGSEMESQAWWNFCMDCEADAILMENLELYVGYGYLSTSTTLIVMKWPRGQQPSS